MQTNRIIHGDCIGEMKDWPDKSIDFILTDPPYGISENPAKIFRKGGKFGEAKTIHRGISENPDTVKGVDYKDWLSVSIPKLTDVGVLITFCKKESISEIYKFIQELGMKVRQIGAWIKANPPPQARKVKWMDAWESFIIATRNEGTGHHYNYEEGQHRDVIETPICMGDERTEHPTQKPKKLAEPLIKWWSFEGDLIVDPFCGTGTFPVVAKELNRKFIGIEKDKDYAKIAKKRINEIPERLDKFT